MALLAQDAKTVSETIKADAMYQLANEWNEIIKTRVNPSSKKNKRQIDSLQSIYMKAQMELFPEKKFFP